MKTLFHSAHLDNAPSRYPSMFLTVPSPMKTVPKKKKILNRTSFRKAPFLNRIRGTKMRRLLLALLA